MYSTQILKFKEVQKQIKQLQEQRKQILDDFLPELQKAILKKMDWNELKLNSYDYSLGSIMISVSNPAEKEEHRYVFSVKIQERDEYYLDLNFREVFNPSYY